MAREQTTQQRLRFPLAHLARSFLAKKPGQALLGLALLFLVLCAIPVSVTGQERPLRPLALHPDNPHYFLFRGKPTIIITSAEHYGAVINLDFDYRKYLDELAKHGLNNTRTFTGAYVEPAGAFNIASNTLAPPAGRFLCPWARSAQPGYAGGGNKFDLSKWDPAYFMRLKDFLTQASQRGIIVELNLFCPFYEEPQWKLSPLNADNNVNGIGKIARTEAYTLDKHGGLLAVQQALVEKIVTELNEFDNLYYEICNEPYFGGVTLAWQRHIADVIVSAEKQLPNQHLISQNIANGAAKVDNPHPAVSVFNFHYASPPDAVAQNYGLRKVIGDNETGFKGTGDDHYRKEAWQFILAGGALYNNLDYSFAAGHEDGTFQYPASQPGGGNRKLRGQLRTLRDFSYRFEFLKLKPVEVSAKLPEKGTVYALAETGRQFAAYAHGAAGGEIVLSLPQGKFEIFFVNPVDGMTRREIREHSGGDITLPLPEAEVAVGVRSEK